MLTNKLRTGRRVLGAVVCVGMAVGVTACTDATQLSCKDLNGNPGALDAMVQKMSQDDAFKSYFNPNGTVYGTPPGAASDSQISSSGITNEFKRQVGLLCNGSDKSVQPYNTALNNTKSFAGGTKVDPPSGTPAAAEPSQSNSAGSNSGSGSSAGSGGSSSGPGGSGNGGSNQGSGSGMSSSGSCGGCSSSSGPVANGSSGSQSSGSQGSGSQGSGSQGSSSSSGGSSSGSSSSGSSGSGSGGSGSGISEPTGAGPSNGYVP